LTNGPEESRELELLELDAVHVLQAHRADWRFLTSGAAPMTSLPLCLARSGEGLEVVFRRCFLG